MSHRRLGQPLAYVLLALTGLAGAAEAQTPPPAQTAPPAQAQPQTPPQYSATLNVGDPAPAFKLPGSDGKTHSLADYKGKTVILAWFPKAFTGG
jgi:hypothetical protein